MVRGRRRNGIRPARRAGSENRLGQHAGRDHRHRRRPGRGKKLDDEFTPRKAKIDEQEKEIAALQAQLDKGGLSDDAKEKLGADIDHKTLMLKIETENADGDLRAAQMKVLHDLAPKMIACIAQYAKSKGYAMVFDTSDSDVPKLYPNTVDITKEVIAEYEKLPQSRSKTSK